MSVGLLDKAADALVPRGITGVPYRRLAEAAYGVRVLVAISALATAWWLPGATQRQKLLEVVLVGFVYLPYALIIWRVSRRSDGPGLRLATVAGDIGIVFMFQAVLPPNRIVALLGYMLIVAFYSFLGGLRGGMSIAVLATALTIVNDVFFAPRPLGVFNITLFAAAAGSMVLLLNAATQQQRRATQRLAQLHASLRAIADNTDPRALLDSVAASARESVGARLSLILLNEDGELHARAAGGAEQELSAFMERDGITFAVAAARKVIDLGSKGEIVSSSELPRELQALGFKAMACVPMRAQGQPTGAMQVYFGSSVDVEGASDLLSAYADQAAVVIARTLADERLIRAEIAGVDFVSTVSHELRTPLTAIAGFTTTLDQNWERLSEDDKRLLVSRAAQGATEMRDLIEQILELSRAESGRAKLEIAERSVKALISGQVEGLSEALGDHQLVMDVPDDLDVAVDVRAFDRIISNLLTNAAKFSENGTPIMVRAEAVGGEVVVSVTDKGSGIPPQELDRIFEKFYRAERRGRVAGAGIGLNIAALYAQMHGGKLWARSELGLGSTFYVSLPAAGQGRSGSV